MSDALPLRRRAASAAPATGPAADAVAPSDPSVLARVADLLRGESAPGADEGERTAPQALT